jgi:hypothetical protein
MCDPITYNQFEKSTYRQNITTRLVFSHGGIILSRDALMDYNIGWDVPNESYIVTCKAKTRINILQVSQHQFGSVETGNTPPRS